jgi:DNA-binding MarR family transcriptional regulator
MIESITARKHKVTLSDYDFKRDIENRLLLSQLTTDEHAVLEEILFSPIRTTVRKIAKSIDIPEDTVLNILQKIAKTGLVVFEEDAVVLIRKQESTLKLS